MRRSAIWAGRCGGGLFLFWAASGCAIEGEPIAPIELATIQFHICGPDMGVHPDDCVLEDPENPFATVALSDASKWQIQTRGAGIAAFFAWATLNARTPAGEAQFYAAQNLALARGTGLSAEEDSLTLALSLRSYRAVLDHFPGSVTWDASGTTPYDLGTMAYKAILALGGKVDDWVLVSTADGGQQAIRIR
jgi:hypothetical protein